MRNPTHMFKEEIEITRKLAFGETEARASDPSGKNCKYRAHLDVHPEIFHDLRPRRDLLTQDSAEFRRQNLTNGQQQHVQQY